MRNYSPSLTLLFGLGFLLPFDCELFLSLSVQHPVLESTLLLLLLSRFSRVQLCATPYTAAHQAPPSLGVSRQEHFAAAAAKSLQSCPTLCGPMDCSLPGSPIPGILQARTLEWVAISFSNA